MTQARCFSSPETGGVLGEDQGALSLCPAEPELRGAGHLHRSLCVCVLYDLIIRGVIADTKFIFCKVIYWLES